MSTLPHNVLCSYSYDLRRGFALKCFHYDIANIPSQGQIYALIDWKEEGTSSVVPCLPVSEGTFTVGEFAWVKTNGGRFYKILLLP